jgi:hypothetical protein
MRRELAPLKLGANRPQPFARRHSFLHLGEGQEDMFTILRLAGENLAAKIQLTQIRASRLRERVNLHLALGGDFKGTGAPAK